MKLSKSLKDLDKLADRFLAKSKNLNPDEVSEDYKDKDEETPEEETKAPVKEPKEDDEEETIEKSEEEAQEGEEPIEKSEGEEPEEGKEDPVEKSDSEDEEDDDEDDEEPVETPEEIEGKYTEEFAEDEEIRKSLQESEFVSSVVEVLAKSLGRLDHGIQNSTHGNNQAQEIIAKSLGAVMQANNTLMEENSRLTRRIAKLEKSMNNKMDEVLSALDDFAIQPAGMRKSVRSTNLSVHDRDFQKSLNGNINPLETLSKSQVLNVLNTELFNGNPQVSAQDIISFESGAPLREDLQILVHNKAR